MSDSSKNRFDQLFRCKLESVESSTFIIVEASADLADVSILFFVRHGAMLAGVFSGDPHCRGTYKVGTEILRWRIPSLIMASHTDLLTIYDVVHNDQYDINLDRASSKSNRSDIATDDEQRIFWPHGIAGEMRGCFTEINKLSFVQCSTTKFSGKYHYGEPFLTNIRVPHFVRYTLDEPISCIIHLAVPTGKLHGKQAKTRVWLRTLTDFENLKPETIQVYLSRFGPDGFEPTTSQKKSYAFADFRAIDIELTAADALAFAEQSAMLFFSIAIDGISEIDISQVELQHLNSSDSLFEDYRLTESFKQQRKMTRVLKTELPDGVLKLDHKAHQAELIQGACPGTDIIIPVYNGLAAVERCISSLLKYTTTDHNLIVIDDGSNVLTQLALRKLLSSHSHIRYVPRDLNRGYTKTVNEALSLSSSEWVVVLNSDTVVSPGWLHKLHECAASRPGVGMVGPLSNAASWQSIPRTKTVDGRWDQNTEILPESIEIVSKILEECSPRSFPAVPLLNGFCTLINRKVFELCGLFDEDAFPEGYGEETDLCLRAVLSGFSLLIADNCFVYHEKSVSFGSSKRANLSKRGNLVLRNRYPWLNFALLEDVLQYNPCLTDVRLKMALQLKANSV